MSKIIKNSAKCTACEEEIESTHRHDFKVHYCRTEPGALVWDEDSEGYKLDLETFRFAVDGGTAYIRRVGTGFMDTSIYEPEIIRIPVYE